MAAVPPPRPPRWQIAAVLAVFIAAFALLTLASSARESATWDEPGDLVAGYAALVDHDYRVDIEHPPLGRMWTALPLAFMKGVTFDDSAVDATTPDVMALGGPFDIGHRFLFVDNDATRLLRPARCMNVVLGAALGVLLFFWVLEWLGFRAAVVGLALYLLEPNLAASAGLATNDLAVAGFVFGAVSFLWRAVRRPNAGNLAGLSICFVAAVLSKFSALVLGPIVLVLLGVAVWRRAVSIRAAIAIVALLAAATWVGVWAAYGFRYLPSQTSGWQFALYANPVVRADVPGWAAATAWVEAHRLLPNAFVEGFLHGEHLAQARPAFLDGQYSAQGWWYYFPIAFALKTPLALLALMFGGVALAVWRRRLLDLGGEAFALVPIVLFFGFAMTSHLNIGVRHILPVYPFALLFAVLAAHALIESGRLGRFALGGLALAGAIEAGSVYPDTLAFMNVAGGGTRGGYRYLADSNLDWGQALIPLKAWMDAHQVREINLAYFGTADPAYYGITSRYIWGTTVPGADRLIGPPTLPGYVAISATLLDGVPFQPTMRDFYKPLRDRPPDADIGGSIFVYWVDAPWWR